MTEENEKTSTEEIMQTIAESIATQLHAVNNDELGFTLLVFPLGVNENARVNYISNAHREDMIQSFKDAIEQLENSKP